MYTSTTGIILRETNYKEADKILTVLTRDQGKLTVKARGCRRKNSKLAAACQLLVFSEMTLFQRGEFITLQEATPVEQFWGVREDFNAFSLASYFAELCQVCAEEGMPHPEILSLLLNSLYALDTLRKPHPLVKLVFELRLMGLIGYEPLLEGCAVCGAAEPENPCLHLRNGVIHCARCRDEAGEGVSMPLTAGGLQAMRHIAWGDGKKLFSFSLQPDSLQRLADGAEAFVLTQLERGFHTLDYYKAIQGGYTVSEKPTKEL